MTARAAKQTKPPRRITILGLGLTALERRVDILRYCGDTEIWSLNNAYTFFASLHKEKRFDRMYELHGWSYLRTWSAGELPDGKQINHFAELNALGCPVVTSEPMPLLKHRVPYPSVEVWSRYAVPRTRYDHHGNAAEVEPFLYKLGSPSLMLAHALLEHDCGETIESIQSYGIDTADTDHGQQRASWAWWCALAHARGITMGGTMLGFMDEYEKDEGLTGWTEHVAKLAAKANTQGASKAATP